MRWHVLSQKLPRPWINEDGDPTGIKIKIIVPLKVRMACDTISDVQYLHHTAHVLFNSHINSNITNILFLTLLSLVVHHFCLHDYHTTFPWNSTSRISSLIDFISLHPPLGFVSFCMKIYVTMVMNKFVAPLFTPSIVRSINNLAWNLLHPSSIKLYVTSLRQCFAIYQPAVCYLKTDVCHHRYSLWCSHRGEG